MAVLNLALNSAQISRWRTDDLHGKTASRSPTKVTMRTENTSAGWQSMPIPDGEHFDVMLLCDGSGRITFVSPSVTEFLGIGPEWLVGKHVRDFVDSTDWARAEALLPGPGCVGTAVVRGIAADGTPIPVECIVTNLLDVPGFRHLVVHIRRASAERLSFEEVWRRERWLNSLLDTLSDLVIVVDSDEVVAYANAAVEGVFGVPRHQVHGASLDRFVRSNDIALVRKALHATVATGRPAAPISCRVHPADGTERWLDIVGTARFAGDELQGAVLAARDITERRAVEERLGLLESAVTRLQEAVLILEAQPPHRVVFANAAACALTGWTMEELTTGEAPAVLQVDSAERGVVALVAALTARQTAIETHDLTIRDGSTIGVETSVAPVLDADGETSHIIAIMRDLTETRLLDVELRHSQKLEAMGRLSAGIAHEINTPIQFIGDNVQFLSTAFLGVVELLGHYRGALLNADRLSWSERKTKVEEAEHAADVAYLETEVPRALQEAVEGIDRVATIVRAMKAFGHPDNAEQRAADLNEAIINTLTVARNEIKYVADVATDLGDVPPIVCHLGDLNQVLLNLLVNAAHAIQDKADVTGERGTITVRTRHTSDSAVITVTDTGAGIAAEHRPYLFEPFFTTKAKGQGTGQGLALARTIIQERHGGRIEYDTEVGVGTTFTLHLPIRGRAQIPS